MKTTVVQNINPIDGENTYRITYECANKHGEEQQKELIEKICILNDSEITVEYQVTPYGDIHGIYADINKMKKLLGIDQPIELDQGLLKMIAWMKTQ